VLCGHDVGGSLDELPVAEGSAGADQGDEVGCVDRPPPLLRGLDEFERHGQPSRAATRSFGDSGAVPDGGEGRLDRVGGAQVDPVLGRES
jgi:hypothetical protein